MRSLTRNLLVAGGGVAIMLVVGASCIPAHGDGEYHLQIAKEGDNPLRFKLLGDDNPKPGPYRTTRPLGGIGTIDWIFTNGMSEDIVVSIQNWECNNAPTTECPLEFVQTGAGCDSKAFPIKAGGEETISATDYGKNCQGTGHEIWDYKVIVQTKDGQGEADPQLEIDRDGRAKALGAVKSVLRSVKQFLHL